MRYKVQPREGYLLAEMVERETSEETAEFVRALVAGIAEHKAVRVLISVQNSRPIYKVEGWGLSGAIETLKAIEGFRVAFIADSAEMAMAQQYIALLLSQRGILTRNCESAADAVAWLHEN
ncbi:MAG TPA: hypothetical protein VM140_12255 [Burkholderiales bacterium]|nr:hypothetical protein [Burkholderiales bacterium]